MRDYGQHHGPQRLDATRRYAERHPERRKDGHLRAAHGVTLEWFKAQLLVQENRCAVCKRLFEENRKPYVDHVHDETQRVRELLCQHCNSMLGFAGDNTEVLSAAIEYLHKHSN